MTFWNNPARTKMVGAVCLGVAAVSVAAQKNASSQPTTQTTEIAPGLSMTEVTIPGAGPLFWPLPAPEGSEPALHYWVIRGKASQGWRAGMELADATDATKKFSVRTIANRTKAMVAVNGNFFAYGGAPVGAVRVDGKWQRPAWKNRTALGWKPSGEKRIGNLESDVVLNLNGLKTQKVTLNGLSRAYSFNTGNDYAVLDPFYGKVAAVPPSSVALVVQNGRITAINLPAPTPPPPPPPGPPPAPTLPPPTGGLIPGPTVTTPTPSGAPLAPTSNSDPGLAAPKALGAPGASSPLAPPQENAAKRGLEAAPTNQVPPVDLPSPILPNPNPPQPTPAPAALPPRPVAIPADGFLVVALNPEASATLARQAVGKPAGWAVTCRPKEWEAYPHIIGAGPRLVAAGKVFTTEVQEEFRPDVIRRGPRTAVGWDKEGNWMFLVVDGRQPASSGLDLPGVAALLVQLGAVEAMNFDGGSSTQLVVNGQLVNSPSGKDPVDPTRRREVWVPNILVLKKN